MKRTTRLALVAALLGSAAFIPATASAATPTCLQLATDPANGLAGNSIIISPTATLVPAAGSNAAYCRVDFILSEHGGPQFGYAVGQQQRVTIRVGLPLNSADGGTNGVQGAWNGKTRNIGGGGCVGSVGSVTSATNTGYVGSSTDAGHTDSDCSFALKPDPHKLNIGTLRDNFYDSIVDQVRWAKTLAKTYYGMKAARNYWDGCSTGGRQGFAIAQKFPEELDGWLVGAPGVHYGRFRTEQIWGQVVMKDLVGGPIAAAKLNQATASAVAACDTLDGIADGIVNEPRRCTWSATNNICGRPGAPATNCLTEAEATAVDLIWDGPRNSKGKKVFHAYSRPASLTAIDGTNPSVTATSQVQWDHQDATFDWHTLKIADYGAEAELGSNVNGDLINVQSPDLDKVRHGGKKILMWQGEADQLIQTDNSLYYYEQVARHYGGGAFDFHDLQSWFRYFRAPGVAHCGGGNGPQPVGLFDAMVNWVENGIAPDKPTRRRRSPNSN